MSWFISWFNSPYYHKLYKDRNDKEAHFFIDNICNYLKVPPNSNVLDLACGKGRHSIYLSKKGYKVTGLDLSEENIQYAEQFKTDSLEFKVHDMRQYVSFREFDYVFNLFTSFGYFEDDFDDRKVLNVIEDALVRKGKLVLDYLNPTYVLNNLVEKEEKMIDGVSFNITRKVENNHIIKDIEFTDLGKSFHYQEKVKLINLQKFKDYFDSVGLTLLNTFGDYGLSEFNIEKSPRLILVAQK